MKRRTLLLPLLLLALTAAAPAPRPQSQPDAGIAMPWRQAGWSERQAAAHLLDRFAYGARPGEVDRVVEIGIEAWFARQLAADLPEDDLERRLAPLDALALPAAEMAPRSPGRGQALRRFYAQLAAAKLLSAVYAENQLREVMTDFWFNHFNVSMTDPEARGFVAAYERDAVRPHVLADFRSLLGATARHPAMLLYLDNARSVADPGAPTLLDRRRAAARDGRRRGGFGGRRGGVVGRPGGRAVDRPQPRPRRPNAPSGLNENYARELLELHTLGVDGGYDQDDVVAVARAFTGWTALPPEGEERLAAATARFGAERLHAAGFVRDGGFLFRADAHDAGPKVILGHRFPAGGGVEEGERVLDLLAAHPSTARHLAEKLARRFVADDPPPGLVARLAAVFTARGGDHRALLVAVVESPEFWAPEARRAKVKTPFELVASALRASGAEVADAAPLVARLAAMGQRPYACAPPTGWEDRAEAWVGTGALLARMNFALALAAGEIEGSEIDLEARLTDAAESPEAHLEGAFTRLLPERDAAPTLAALAAAGEVATEPRRALGLVLGSPEFQRR